eukprot:TRINITY_DN5212_c0_g1_i1.p1 TRINITY_DN5212_c0_g1~~TRINITY_DN5212_c0_g1_i1.p1  ORF type:complete len:505 (-),score=66.19 TRINITY_DN5212_c0_g1_i1:161-1615(-)
MAALGLAGGVEELQRRWQALCKKLAISDEATDKWWGLIRSRYGEVQRHYHTLNHLGELFALFDKHRADIADACSVELAIFFHDVIYNPRATGGRNEDDSALVFSKFAQEVNLCPAEMVGKVFRWIIKTKHHVCQDDDDADCKLFMDFDMAVLGWERAAYSHYTVQVRREFAHVPEGIWCDARANFLEATAASPKIFATSIFQERYEELARANMRWEAAELRVAYSKLSLWGRVIARLFKNLKARPRSVCGAGVVAAVVSAWSIAPSITISAGTAMVAATCGTALVSGVPLVLYLGLGTTFLQHPLKAPPHQRRGSCVYAGSFNPAHNGHLELIKFLASTYAKVHVVIGVNPNKTYPVCPFVRRELLCGMIAEVGLVQQVEVKVVAGYVWRFGFEVGAERFYRGIRSWRKDGFEEKMLECLNLIGPLLLARRLPIRTAYLQASPRWNFVSSTLLRDCIRKGQGVEEIVPPGSAKAITEAYSYLAK